MINLRYHIVSLSAVFLALGLGILAGTTVIDQEVVKRLEGNTRALERDLQEVRVNVSALEREIGVWEGFGRAVVPSLLQGRLAGRGVVLVADRGTPADLLRDLSDTFALAGANRPTRVLLTDRWKLDQAATVQQLASAVGAGNVPREEVLARAANRLAARLGGSSDPRADRDLIRILENSGFLDVDDLPDAGAFPTANALVVVVTSGAENAVPDEDTFFIPFLRVITSRRIVGVAEPTGAVRSMAEKVRGDRPLARSICTVDHADTVAGRLSLVYALRDLGAGNVAAHYGVRNGADGVTPDLRSA